MNVCIVFRANYQGYNFLCVLNSFPEREAVFFFFLSVLALVAMGTGMM